MRMFRRVSTFAAAVAAVGLFTACMGQFQLTRRLYDFNDKLTGNKYLNNVVFWVIAYFIPVYGLALAGDLFILNVIEFWTGNNLLASGVGDGEARVAVTVEERADGSVVVTRGDEVFTAKPMGGNRVQVSSAAGVLGTAEVLADGSLVLMDKDGVEMAIIPVEDLQATAPALAHLAAHETDAR